MDPLCGFLGREIILTAYVRPHRFQCLPFSGSKACVISGRARGRGQRRTQERPFVSTFRFVTAYLCPRSSERRTFFANHPAARLPPDGISAAPLPPEFHGRGFFTRPCHSIWLPPCCTSLFYGSDMEDSCFRPCRHFVCNYLKTIENNLFCALKIVKCFQ